MKFAKSHFAPLWIALSECIAFQFVAKATRAASFVVLLLATQSQIFAERAPQSKSEADQKYRKVVIPFVQKYCTDCHGSEEMVEGINLARYPNVAAIEQGRATWERVYEILNAGAMPPDDVNPRPSDLERERVVEWLRIQLFEIDCSLPGDPGRVTIRRLNRAEYNNTIRDLFGLDLKPAANFPSDDVGEGFDNIGDVLSLSPLLVEKYLDAAEEVVEQAIYVPDPEKAPKQHWEEKKLKHEGSGSLQGDVHAFPSRGAVITEAKFPKDGKYILRAKASAQQAGPDPARMEFRLGEHKVNTFDVTGKREERIYEIAVNVRGGKHPFAAAFINDYYNQESNDPKVRGDRNLYINWLEVQGPIGELPDELPKSHTQIVVCRPERDRDVAKCAERVVSAFARRAFRRPVKKDELTGYIDLVTRTVQAGEPFERGVQLALEAILVSPHFLFRVESHPQPDQPDRTHALNDYELASRLSYFLWSSMPDEELFRLAEMGRLHEDSVLNQQVRRMLRDEKSRALVENFCVQWLNMPTLDEVSPDPQQFKQFDDQLRRDMRQETVLFLETIIREDRSILEILDARFSFLNERLAKLYGLSGITGEEFRRVGIYNGQRAGVLTHASILTLTSNPDRTSPVKRGKWILENILGAPVPPPPDGVPELDATAKVAPTASLREQLELHRESPVCNSCHKTMDQLGFGLENFDAIGRWREKGGRDKIDASGVLPGGASFDGPSELTAVLKSRRDEFSRCLTEKMLTYALGRGLRFYDKCSVDGIVAELKQQDDKFSSLVTAIVRSDPFRMRRGDGGKR